MTAAILAGLIAGYGVAVPIGAIAPLIMSLSARFSLRVGASAALGVAAADGIYAVIAVLGGAALARFIEPVATALRWIAVLILLVMAAHTTIGAVRHYRDPARQRASTGLTTPLRAFFGILGLTLLNPTTILYFGALVIGQRSTDGFAGSVAVAWVIAVFVASASWQLTLAGGGALIGRYLSSPRGRLITALASSLMISVLAVWLIVAK